MRLIHFLTKSYKLSASPFPPFPWQPPFYMWVYRYLFKVMVSFHVDIYPTPDILILLGCLLTKREEILITKAGQNTEKNDSLLVRKYSFLIQLLWKAVWRCLKKLKIELLYDPTNSFQGICSENVFCRMKICSTLPVTGLILNPFGGNHLTNLVLHIVILHILAINIKFKSTGLETYRNYLDYQLCYLLAIKWCFKDT